MGAARGDDRPGGRLTFRRKVLKLSLRRRYAAILFVALLAVWTWKLLEPQPVPEPVLDLIGPSKWLKFLLAKALHLSGYTALAWLGGAMTRTPLSKRLVLAFLLLHGAGTEYAQTFIENRTGKVTDVGIDWTGIALGVAAGWPLWRPAFRRADP